MRLAEMNVTWLWNVIMSASTEPRMLEIKAGSSLVNGKAVRWKKKGKSIKHGGVLEGSCLLYGET